MNKLPYIEFSNPVRIQRTKTLPSIPFLSMRKGLFSDNSLVCYKAGSLAPGGVGTVRNSRSKMFKT